MSPSRRTFLATATAGAGLALGRLGRAQAAAPPLDRAAVVGRHNPRVTALDPFAALSVGNGEFAFNLDITGLQSLPAAYEKQWPLCTLAHWAWHSSPLPAGARREDFRYENHDTYGRAVPYPTNAKGQEPLYNWLRANPHRPNLARLGFVGLTPADVTAVDQRLDLWTGVVTSAFDVRGQRVVVTTCCHAELDAIAVRIEAATPLAVELAFSYGSPAAGASDWRQPAAHTTTVDRPAPGRADLTRQLDADRYHVRLAWIGGELTAGAPHHFTLTGPREFVCGFGRERDAHPLPDFAAVQASSAAGWRAFWTSGAAIDFGGCTDPRAPELERRVVLSQYNTAVHCAGSLPSQETGLLCNSWNGKFHLEMHWWHSVHFVPWGRYDKFARTLPYYQRILPTARAWAAKQGYRGARWPKMVGPDGHDSPSPVGPLLIWQQPHPLYYAELAWRHAPTPQTLATWREVVHETAEFMASYVVFDAAGRAVLGPPLKPVSENQPADRCFNATFELAYWRFGLRVAQLWRQRLGLPPEPTWAKVQAALAPLPTADGVYLMHEGLTDTYTKYNFEHPSLVGALGVQPGDGVDRETMRRTVRKVMSTWRWAHTWGWDFPMMAMACARAGEPDLAVDALLLASPKNRYLPNGHNYQRDGLTAYLPGNGGLLAAVALMAGGWTDGPDDPAPGFPRNGAWAVRAEGFTRAL